MPRPRRTTGIALPTLAQKCLALIDSAHMAATYKIAAFTAILDVTVEGVDSRGRPPRDLPVRLIGRAALERYWPQAVHYHGGPHLSQSTQRNDIVEKLAAFRRAHHLAQPSVRLEEAEQRYPSEMTTLERRITLTMANMPLRLLQRFGDGGRAREDSFLYSRSWKSDTLGARDLHSATLRLRPDVGIGLILLAPLLRTHLENQWTRWVSEHNASRVPHSDVHEYLFGAERVPLAVVANVLVPAQKGHCFYCGATITAARAHVDHVIPWSVSRDNGLDNLVAACAACNLDKKALLPGLTHLALWAPRLRSGSADDRNLAILAKQHGLLRNRMKTSRIARAAFGVAPPGTSCWNARGILVAVDVRKSLLLIP